MRKTIIAGSVIIVLISLVSSGFAYQPSDEVLKFLPHSFPAFSVRSINEKTLGRLLKEILYLFSILRKIEAEIDDKIDKITERDLPEVAVGKIAEPSQGNSYSSQDDVYDSSYEGTSEVDQVGAEPSSGDSSGKIKIAIIDIDPEHAAQVKAVMEERIRRENPGANIEIRTIILPGEWQSDGSKAVATGDILNAFAQAKAWGAKVINMSIGSQGGIDNVIRNALRDLYESGILVVAASGNEGSYDAWGQAGPYVLSVGVRGAPYSNSADLYINWGELPWGLEGTSFAAPIIAAEAALRMLENPSLSLASLTSLLGSSEAVYAGNYPVQRSTQDFYTSSLGVLNPLILHRPVEEEFSLFAPDCAFPCAYSPVIWP
ncbi:MAG: S8 family serine peptidase [Candidatus Omnitrophota bacterium]